MGVEKIKSEEHTSVAGVGSDPLPIYITQANAKTKNSVISALFSRLINQRANKMWFPAPSVLRYLRGVNC